jgi:hypothetical protein
VVTETVQSTKIYASPEPEDLSPAVAEPGMLDLLEDLV